MNSYKCEFCIHQVGPIKPVPPECAECRCGNHFQIKTKMHPMDIRAWGKHQRLDRFIDEVLTIPVVLWQREVLHQALKNSRSDRQPQYARFNGRSQARAIIDVYLAIFDEYEKGRERSDMG